MSRIVATDAEALGRAAEQLVGAPFRLHGRDPATGLDCLGVAIVALETIGRPVRWPTGYTLRTRDLASWLPDPIASGFRHATGPLEPGDLLLVRPSPCQYHLIVAATAGRFVHADAGLRRVTLIDGPLEWPPLHHWRLAPTD